MSVHNLECYFCPYKFASFKELAEHVTKSHTTGDVNNAVTETDWEQTGWFSQNEPGETTAPGRRRL